MQSEPEPNPIQLLTVSRLIKGDAKNFQISITAINYSLSTMPPNSRKRGASYYDKTRDKRPTRQKSEKIQNSKRVSHARNDQRVSTGPGQSTDRSAADSLPTLMGRESQPLSEQQDRDLSLSKPPVN